MIRSNTRNWCGTTPVTGVVSVFENEKSREFKSDQTRNWCGKPNPEHQKLVYFINYQST